MKKAKRLTSLLLIILALSVFSAPAYANTGGGSGDPQGTTQRPPQPTPPPNQSLIDYLLSLEWL